MPAYSASNYLLGLMPVSTPAYLGGTMMGAAVWAVLYATVGGASREVLKRGANMEVLFAGRLTTKLADPEYPGLPQSVKKAWTTCKSTCFYLIWTAVAVRQTLTL